MGHYKTSFIKQFQGGKGKDYVYGGRGILKGVSTFAPPIKSSLYQKSQANNLNIKYSFDICIFSILSILFLYLICCNQSVKMAFYS